jgi:predicted nucleic acid-binding protein
VDHHFAVDARRGSLPLPPGDLEFWTAATRPTAQNGLAFTTPQAVAEVVQFRSLFRLLPDQASIYAEWEKLVRKFDVKGKNAHDARIVAAMNIHGVSELVTFNAADFSRYAEIKLYDPSAMESAGASP